jgi:CBS domain-containing protein
LAAAFEYNEEMFTPYVLTPRQPNPERPLGPQPLHRISPVQAIQNFFPHASDTWVESVSDDTAQAPVSDGLTQAASIMQPGVLTVRVDTPLRDLVKILTQRRISGAPVVDLEGKPTGVISLTDIAAYVGQSWLKSNSHSTTPMAWEDALGESLGETLVQEVMSPFVYYAEESTGLLELAEMMMEHHIHRVLIVRETEIVGIVSSLDLIKAFHEANRPCQHVDTLQG